MAEAGELGGALLASYGVRFRKLKELGDGALARLSETDWHHVPPHGENSIAIIVQHLEGNMRSRWTDFLVTDGEKENRERDSEFTVQPELDGKTLWALWEGGWSILLHALDALAPEDLLKTVEIRRQPLLVLDAINRQLAHYGYHVGQIVYLARMYRGDAWESISIAKGKSTGYQARPDD